MTQATCISCSTDTDLVSVHDELSLDGTESPQAQSSAAALVHYCFNFKIEKLDKPYGICSTCLGLLIQASSYKHHLLNNIDSIKESKDAGENITSTEQLSRRDALRAVRNQLWNEVIERNVTKVQIDLSKIDFVEIEIEARAQASETKKDLLKPNNSKTKKDLLKPNNSKTYVTGARPKFEKFKLLHKKLKDEFFNLHRDCKDFYLFSWFKSNYICVICKEMIVDVDEFKIHVRKHTMKQSKNFYPKKEAYRGADLKVDVSSMKCRYCNESLIGLEQTRNHLSSAHKIDANYLFKQILPFHLEKDNFKCIICNEVFNGFFNLNRHTNEHNKNYTCNHCLKSFATRQRIRAHHLRSHTAGTFKCFRCDETFDSVAKRQNHVAQVHKKCVNLCPHCPGKFKSYVAKLRHLAEVHNEEAKKYECHICHMKFATSSIKSCHVRKLHLGERNHVCTLCGTAFFLPRELSDHMVKHTGLKSYSCDICNKSFGRNRNLLHHKKSHQLN